MIERILSIANVGKFVNCKAVGDVTFKKLTLLYGENGRGKTTLCDVMRSLATGNGDRIQGRKTLGSNDVPSVQILVSGAKHIFSRGSWNERNRSRVVGKSFLIDRRCHGACRCSWHVQNTHEISLRTQKAEACQGAGQIAYSLY
jgi:recombinational DNA repair ATPase RecF